MKLLKRRSFDILRSVTFALVLREVRGRFGANRLGAFWFVFEPLAHIIILIIIFSVIRSRTLPGIDLPMFLVTGIVPFLLFKNVALKGMEAVNANQGLLAYRQIKPFDCILARTIVEFSLMACVYAALIFAFSFWGNSDVVIHQPLKWLATLGIGMAFSFGLALIFCVLVDAVPEAKTFIKLMFMPLYILSGIIFPIWRAPHSLLEFMTWNPYFHLIDTLRRSVFASYPHVSVINEAYPASLAVIVLFIGMGLYRARRLNLVAR